MKRQLCDKENMLHSAKKARIEVVRKNFRSPTKETNTSEKKPTPKSRKKWVTPTFDEKMKAKHNFATPVMLKLPANKIQTPFQRKKTKKEPEPDNPLFSPFSDRQIRLRNSLEERYETAATTTSFPKCICIEGNIGSGKSTLLRKLAEKGYIVLEEPVDKIWDKYLPLYYSDCKRWGMTFQLEVFEWFNKLRTILLPEMCQNHKRIIIERSPQTSFFVFCSYLYENGDMTNWEYDKVKWLYNVITWKAKKVLYLQLEPDLCVERIIQRNRKSESNIPKNRKLIESLHSLHEKVWAQNKDPEIEVICLDASQDIDKVCEDAMKHI